MDRIYTSLDSMDIMGFAFGLLILFLVVIGILATLTETFKYNFHTYYSRVWKYDRNT